MTLINVANTHSSGMWNILVFCGNSVCYRCIILNLWCHVSLQFQGFNIWCLALHGNKMKHYISSTIKCTGHIKNF